jgi:hypothetical protein
MRLGAVRDALPARIVRRVSANRRESSANGGLLLIKHAVFDRVDARRLRTETGTAPPVVAGPTVIVPAFNEAASIADTIASIHAQTTPVGPSGCATIRGVWMPRRDRSVALTCHARLDRVMRAVDPAVRRRYLRRARESARLGRGSTRG